MLYKYLSLKNLVEIYAKIWINFENMLSERCQTQRTIYCMIPFV